MASEWACPSQRERCSTAPILRWSGLVALLLGEMLFITLRFDTVSLAQQDGWWVPFVEHSHFLPQLFIVMLTATFVFGGASISANLNRLDWSDFAHHTSWWRWCALQIAFYGCFVFTTALLFEFDLAGTIAHGILFVLWLLLACATFSAWCCAVAPPRLWLQLVIRHRLALISGVAIGAAALAASKMSDQLWHSLGWSTLWLVAGLLRLSGIDFAIDPHDFVISTSTFAVKLAPACSGYEGLGLAWVFIGTYLWWSRDSLVWPNAWLLLLLATALMWLLNGVRIAGLVLIASYGWKEVALGGFHSQAGWIAFNAVAIALVVASQRFRFFCRDVEITQQSTGPETTAAYLTPLLTLVATIMVSNAFSSGFDWLYPVRVVVVACVALCFWTCYSTWRWNWSWTAVVIGIATFVVWMCLEPAPPESSSESALANGLASLSSGWAAAWLVFRVLGAVVIIPFVEEIAFRGYLQRRLQNADFTEVPASRFSWFSFLVSSALFGALHPGRFIAGTLAGMLFAIAVYRRGNIVDAIVAHATTNALIAFYVLSTQSWHLW